MISALRWVLCVALAGTALHAHSYAAADETARHSCSDGPTMEFLAHDLPGVVPGSTSSASVFTIGETDLTDGAWSRFDVTIAITLSEVLSEDDHGLVSVYVNGKTFLLIQVSPNSAAPDHSQWFVSTLLRADEGEFTNEQVVLELSNYLQVDSLKEGDNIVSVTVNNVRGSRIESAALLEPTTLIADARSPYLLNLDVSADDDPWAVGKESIVEAAVEPQGSCALEEITIDIRPIAGAGFDRLPAAPLEPVSYEGRPIHARFALIPRDLGPLEFAVVASADGQDSISAIITRTSGEPNSNRIDANNLVGYIVFGAISATGVWLVFSRRRTLLESEPTTPGE